MSADEMIQVPERVEASPGSRRDVALWVGVSAHVLSLRLPASAVEATGRDVSALFTFIEYSRDPDPEDTTIETIYFFMITEDGSLRIEKDRHITEMFPTDTWLELFDKTGFDVEHWPYLGVHESGREGILFVGILK